MTGMRQPSRELHGDHRKVRLTPGLERCLRRAWGRGRGGWGAGRDQASELGNVQALRTLERDAQRGTTVNEGYRHAS